MPIGNHTLPTTLLSSCSRSEGTMWCLSKWAFDVTGGAFWTVMLLGFVIVLFIATSRLGSTRAFGYASFVGMIGSMFLGTLQLMPWWTVSAFIITGLIGIASMVLSEK